MFASLAIAVIAPSAAPPRDDRAEAAENPVAAALEPIGAGADRRFRDADLESWLDVEKDPGRLPFQLLGVANLDSFPPPPE